MTRWLVLLLALAGCSGPVPPTCPGPVPVPARLHPHESVGALEIRVELARERERRRGDACAEAVERMQK